MAAARQVPSWSIASPGAQLDRFGRIGMAVVELLHEGQLALPVAQLALDADTEQERLRRADRRQQRRLQVVARLLVAPGMVGDVRQAYEGGDVARLRLQHARE